MFSGSVSYVMAELLDLVCNFVLLVVDVFLNGAWYWGQAGVPGYAALVAGSIHDDAVLLHDRLALHAFRSPLIVTFRARQPQGVPLRSQRRSRLRYRVSSICKDVCR